MDLRRFISVPWVRALLIGAGFVLLVQVAALTHPYQGYSEETLVLIKPGMSRRAIADKLTERGVLHSRWPFLLYAYAQPFRTLKAGEYSFQTPLSPAGVFRKLVRAEVRLYALTIPEGYTLWDIAEDVARLELASRQAFLAAARNPAPIADLAPEALSLEGFLFPDTYHFARPADPAAMVRAMVERFRSVYRELESAAANPAKLNAYKLVTLASLVEKETGEANERGLIASVFYNRLGRNMLLACDPTVIYAARLEADGAFDGVINVSDLERDSPYNTYRRRGLPPGPIASPGRAALEAVLNPPDSSYLYFVSNAEGGHFFASTAAQHARNVARYRRLRRRQQHSAGSP